MKSSLEYDLVKIDWISQKCKNSKTYAQNLYAALCNNRFYKNEDEWTCSWRFAGGLVADLIGNGDYLDWYCSGMGCDTIKGYVGEGFVTPEINNDLLNLGWIYRPYEPKLETGLYRNDWS